MGSNVPWDKVQHKCANTSTTPARPNPAAASLQSLAACALERGMPSVLQLLMDRGALEPPHYPDEPRPEEGPWLGDKEQHAAAW